MMKQKVLDHTFTSSSIYDETKSFGSTPLPHPLDATAKKFKWQSISNQQFQS